MLQIDPQDQKIADRARLETAKPPSKLIVTNNESRNSDQLDIEPDYDNIVNNDCSLPIEHQIIPTSPSIKNKP